MTPSKKKKDDLMGKMKTAANYQISLSSSTLIFILVILLLSLLIAGAVWYFNRDTSVEDLNSKYEQMTAWTWDDPQATELFALLQDFDLGEEVRNNILNSFTMESWSMVDEDFQQILNLMTDITIPLGIRQLVTLRLEPWDLLAPESESLLTLLNQGRVELVIKKDIAQRGQLEPWDLTDESAEQLLISLESTTMSPDINFLIVDKLNSWSMVEPGSDKLLGIFKEVQVEDRSKARLAEKFTTPVWSLSNPISEQLLVFLGDRNIPSEMKSIIVDAFQLGPWGLNDSQSKQLIDLLENENLYKDLKELIVVQLDFWKMSDPESDRLILLLSEEQVNNYLFQDKGLNESIRDKLTDKFQVDPWDLSHPQAEKFVDLLGRIEIDDKLRKAINQQFDLQAWNLMSTHNFELLELLETPSILLDTKYLIANQLTTWTVGTKTAEYLLDILGGGKLLRELRLIFAEKFTVQSWTLTDSVSKRLILLLSDNNTPTEIRATVVEQFYLAPWKLSDSNASDLLALLDDNSLDKRLKEKIADQLVE